MAVSSVNAASTKPARSSAEDGVITVKKGSALVKIYPVSNRGKPLFMVTWFVAGHRHRRNFTNEVEARKEAALVATKLSAGEAQVLLLTSGDRESYLEAKRLLAPLGIPLGDAIKDYVAARTLLQEDALFQKAEIKWKHNALRHSFASYRLASEQNAAQLALEMGNSPTMIFRHYRELTTPNEASRWWCLGLPVAK